MTHVVIGMNPNNDQASAVGPFLVLDEAHTWVEREGSRSCYAGMKWAVRELIDPEWVTWKPAHNGHYGVTDE